MRVDQFLVRDKRFLWFVEGFKLWFVEDFQCESDINGVPFFETLERFDIKQRYKPARTSNDLSSSRFFRSVKF